MNVVNQNVKAKEEDSPEEKLKRKALRPKSAAAPPLRGKFLQEHVGKCNPLIDGDERGQIFAISTARGKRTRHIVGQAAWGIPLDNWATVCGWNFARRNVKVELTRELSEKSSPCKKCAKIEAERDGVRGAREWAHQMEV